MSNKPKQKGTLDITEIREFFEQNPEIKVDRVDLYLVLKLIVHALDSCLTDSDGNPPNFTINNNFVFIELEPLRLTLEIRDSSRYS